MALKLCGTCERHVRESDATCPYCGGEEAAKVPAPAKLNRKAMYFAAVVMTTAAVETVSCVALYGASVDCEVEDCGYPRRCQGIPVSAVGQGPLVVSNPAACTEPIYQRLVDACVRDPEASDCPSAARARPDCARCIIGPRDLEQPNMVSPGATLSLSPLVVNTGACAALVLGRPDCAAGLTAYDARVTARCASCADPGSLSACREDQRPKKFASGSDPEREVECLTLRDVRRAEWEPACVGATAEESLDKVAHALCFGR